MSGIYAEIIIRELGLEQCKAVSTPGTNEHQTLANVLEMGMSVVIAEENKSLLPNAAQAKLFRSVVAGCNYIAKDRVDSQHPCKECSRRMPNPRQGDWAALRRIGRYLKRLPMLVQHFSWQSMPETVNVFTDSDWAGCRATCRTISGGIM